jgi:mannose-6-phosphate isomerase
MPDLYPLEGVWRGYAWGSRTAVQSMLGIEVDGSPIAELWFGAHPDDPSPTRGSTLDAVIAADPVALLGADVVERFGPQLPFLLKLLAADRPLSIQVHPTHAQAEAGFLREDAACIARDGANRNYRDRNHKPELLCALTEFEALCGFRPVADTMRLLEQLDVPALAQLRAVLPTDDGLRAAFTHLITLSNPTPVIDAVLERAGQVAGDFAGVLGAMRLANDEFPGDPGVLVILLLNHVRLAAGEAIYLGAGNVHAYLRGVGVEIMANSDNVLRCGLTPKHVDVDEVVAITDFAELAEPRWPRGSTGFDVPVPDFKLEVFDARDDLGPVLRPGSPRIVLCTSGEVSITATDTCPLAPASAVFIPADAAATLSGHGTVFVAAVG